MRAFYFLATGPNLCIYYVLSNLIENLWYRQYYPHLQIRKVNLRKLKYCLTIKKGFCQATTMTCSLWYLQDLSQDLAHSRAMALLKYVS